MEVITKSADQTKKLGEKLAADIVTDKTSPRILCLYGDLGSGKTTFIQGLAKGLGIKKRILSPTFVMVRQYPITNYLAKPDPASRDKFPISNFFHVDLYRVESEKDIQGLGLSETWSNPENVVAIEWAEKVAKILPRRRVDIYFEYISKEERKINIINVS